MEARYSLRSDLLLKCEAPQGMTYCLWLVDLFFKGCLCKDLKVFYRAAVLT